MVCVHGSEHRIIRLLDFHCPSGTPNQSGKKGNGFTADLGTRKRIKEGSLNTGRPAVMLADGEYRYVIINGNKITSGARMGWKAKLDGPRYDDQSGFTLGPMSLTQNYCPSDEYIMGKKVQLLLPAPEPFHLPCRVPSVLATISDWEERQGTGTRAQTKAIAAQSRADPPAPSGGL
ncbi:MAG: hypothetical protein Q9179_001310 [Wetmoreana sp. 5 TL-2023]